MANDEMFVLEGETNKALSLMNKTFYSNKEIFLPELISNASDALDRIQFERIRDKNIVDDELIIRLVPHKGNKTLSIIDTGIGMTKTDLAYNLGVGFYSAYLIADKIIITTKHNDHDEYIWESQKDASFMVTKDINAQQSSRGTNITLFLKDNQLEYLEENTIMNLVIKNCQHISHPIYLWTENTKDHWLLINIWSHNKDRDDKFVAQKLMNHLPNDLVLSVMSNLPFKSLKRFGCLQRSWTLLFENSDFMNLFRNNFIRNQHSYYDDTSLLLLINLPYQNTRKSNLFSVSGERFQNMEKLECPEVEDVYPCGFRILGSCSVNGTLCLYIPFGRFVYLWNPDTNQLNVIPPSPVQSFPDSVNLLIIFHGFGYDCVKDDYKVIRRVCFFYNDLAEMDYFDDGPLCIEDIWEMYSLKYNSWKKVEVDFRVPLLSQEVGESFFFEGMCHWLGCGDGPDAHLVSFDLSNEVFITTFAPLDIPTEIYDNFDMNLVKRHLLLLNGSIALMSNYACTSTFYISILVELGRKETWTKLFVFGPIPDIAFSIGARNLGNILFQTYDSDLAWFDLTTHKIQKFGVQIDGGLCQLVVYKKNLLT
ncbi:uncharacterized protein [Phaseolus vulgaris]|uniref:uncharacterized protein n=1 Tax=Phaseolus vulgaris TaxID=3885 RepID=UPI0035C955D2